jgi:hypothetical protein
MYNLGNPYTSFEWFGTSVIVFIMKNGAGNRSAGIIDQKHHRNSGPNVQLIDDNELIFTYGEACTIVGKDFL